MQATGGSSAAAARPEAILEWLQKEMGYPGPLPSPDQLRKICRGNMVPVLTFLLHRVRSERTAATVRRNILVHGAPPPGRRRERGRAVVDEPSSTEAREAALRERDLAEEEAEQLRNVMRRQRRELRARMTEVAREESERKKMLDERSNARHKQVMLEAFYQQCDEGVRIFAEYQRRLHQYVIQARNVRKLSTGDADADLQYRNEKEAVYSTMKGNKSTDDIILIETPLERGVRQACETLAEHILDRIRSNFPAYEGGGVSLSSQLDVAKLGLDMDSEIPEDVKAVILDGLRSPSLLLRSITIHTSRVTTIIHRDTEKIDIKADAELMRSSDDKILVDTSRERGLRQACETLAEHILDKIRSNFPAYKGGRINLSSQLDVAKLGLDLDSEILEDVKAIVLDGLMNPSLLLHSITTHTSRVTTIIHREMEKIDIKAGA